MSNFIVFGFEGTLSSQDYILDLMGLFPNGDKIYSTLKRYEGLLSTTDKSGYESTNSLAFITPFLILHNIRESDITDLASKTVPAPGAPDLISSLYTNDWRIFCITTDCEPYAIHITHKLGIYAHNVISTPFPLDTMYQSLIKEETDLFQHIEDSVIKFNSTDDTDIKKLYDYFYQRELPTTSVGKFIEQIKYDSSQRITSALKTFSEKYQEPLSKWVAVGSNKDDIHILSEVDREGGMSIAFNASPEALSCATISLSSPNLTDLIAILTAWKKGQRKDIKRFLQEREKKGITDKHAIIHWLAERDKTNIDDVIQIHNRFRQA